jgi:hypothetical protein
LTRVTKCDTLEFTSYERGIEVNMKTEGTRVTYADSEGNLISGVVEGYDSHLRYMIKRDNTSVYEGLAIVDESRIVK